MTHKKEPSGIYWIINKVNNHIYVGSTKYLWTRKSSHLKNLEKDFHPNRHLQAAYNKYGKENFEFEILITCPPELLIWYEQQFIDQLNPEYNIRKTAENNIGITVSEETKKKLSLAKKGIKHSPITEEHREKLKLSHLGYKQSEETKKKKSDLGKKLTISADTREKMKRFGEDHHNAKLSNSDVEEIKSLYSSGDYTQKRLGELFGVGQAYIGRLIRNERRFYNESLQCG